MRVYYTFVGRLNGPLKAKNISENKNSTYNFNEPFSTPEVLRGLRSKMKLINDIDSHTITGNSIEKYVGN